jgi:hypothetical protein
MHVRRLSIGGSCVLLVAILAASAGPAAAREIHLAPVPTMSRQHMPLQAVRPLSTAGLASWSVDVTFPIDTYQPGSEVPAGVSFSDVEAVGPNDAWAVGTSGRYMGFWAKPVVWQWHDGQWAAAAVPSWLDGSQVGGWVNHLQAVGGSSPTDVWLLGTYDLLTETLVRAVHWDGHQWTKFEVPAAKKYEKYSPLQITSVLSLGRQGAWAFGCYCDTEYSPSSGSPYIARFSHGVWHNVTPHGLPFDGIWTASALSPSDIWAVMTDPGTGISALLHWNGRTWRDLPVASFGSSRKPVLFGASGGIVTASDGAVMLSGTTSKGVAAVAQLLKGRWTLTKLPAQGSLAAMVPDGQGGLWAALQPPNSSNQIWHFADGRWSPAADPAGASGNYYITWMAHLPNSLTTVAIGWDQAHELLLHG